MENCKAKNIVKEWEIFWRATKLWDMYLKIHFLDMHLEFIPENIDTDSDELGEHFHQEISNMEKLHRGENQMKSSFR